MKESSCGLTMYGLWQGREVSEISRAIEDNGLIVPSVIAMRQWGDLKAESISWYSKKPEDALRLERDWVLHLSLPRLKIRKPHTWRHATKTTANREGRGLNQLLSISVSSNPYTLKRAWEIVQETEDSDATLILDAFHNWNSRYPR